MKLYYGPASCSLSPHIVLAESGLAYTLEKVNLRETPHRTESGVDFSVITPTGYVPARELDNGELRTEGVAIVQYIADQVPGKYLVPANGTLLRYRLQEMLNFIATEIHKGFSPMWNPANSQEVKDAAWDKLASRFDWLAGQLGDKEYLLGEYSAADAYLFTCLSWAGYLERSLDAWPVLTAYLARIAARPAVQRAMKEEGLI